jgi:hypothetical protein
MRTLLRHAAALVAALAATVVGVFAAPAHADPFPLGLFRIVNAYSGLCADGNWGTSQVGPSPCSNTDLYQRWFWAGSGHQLVNFGNHKCAFGGGFSYAILMDTCRNDEPGQAWQRIPYMSAGDRIARDTPWSPDEGWYFYETNRSFTMDQSYDRPNTRLAFTFQLI